jgi:hypothetical protein
MGWQRSAEGNGPKQEEVTTHGNPAYRSGEKVKLSLCLIDQVLCNEDVWGCGGIASQFLTSALDGGERSSSRSSRLIPGERVPDTHLIGVLVGPRSGVDTVEYRKILPLPEMEPRPSNRSSSLYRLSYPDVPCLSVGFLMSALYFLFLGP